MSLEQLRGTGSLENVTSLGSVGSVGGGSVVGTSLVSRRRDSQANLRAGNNNAPGISSTNNNNNSNFNSNSGEQQQQFSGVFAGRTVSSGPGSQQQQQQHAGTTTNPLLGPSSNGGGSAPAQHQHQQSTLFPSAAPSSPSFGGGGGGRGPGRLNPAASFASMGGGPIASGGGGVGSSLAAGGAGLNQAASFRGASGLLAGAGGVVEELPDAAANLNHNSGVTLPGQHQQQQQQGATGGAGSGSGSGFLGHNLPGGGRSGGGGGGGIRISTAMDYLSESVLQSMEQTRSPRSRRGSMRMPQLRGISLAPDSSDVSAALAAAAAHERKQQQQQQGNSSRSNNNKTHLDAVGGGNSNNRRKSHHDRPKTPRGPSEKSRQRRRFSVNQDDEYRRSNVIETISVSELDKMKKLFDAHDVDKSGSIDEDELMPLLVELGHPMGKEQAVDLLAQVDVNGNGLLEFSEFLQLVLIFKNVAQFRLYEDDNPAHQRGMGDQQHPTQNFSKSPLHSNLELGGILHHHANGRSVAQNPLKPQQAAVASPERQSDADRYGSGVFGSGGAAGGGQRRSSSRDLSAQRHGIAAAAADADDENSCCNRFTRWVSSFFPFRHESAALWAWEMLLLCVCIYIWCSVTSVYSFGDTDLSSSTMSEHFDVADIVVTVLIGFEMFRQAVTRVRIYSTGKTRMLMNVADIAWRYVTSFDFAADLFAIVPMRLAAGPGIAGLVLAHFRLFFLWHLKHIMTRNSFADIDRWFVYFFLSFAPILSGAAAFLCVVHVCAIASFRIELTSSYAEAVYVVLYCFSGAGFGNIRPQNDQHRVFLAVLCLMSMIVNGFVIGSIVSFFSSSDVDSVRKSRLVQTLAVLDFFHVPQPLQEEILQFQNHLMAKNIQTAFASIVESLPSEMKVGLGLQIRIQLVRSVELFRMAHPSTQIALAQELFTVVLCPEEFVALAEELGEEMFFISYGFVDVLTSGGKYCKTLKTYESFGAEVVMGPVMEAMRDHIREGRDDDAPLEINTWGKYTLSAKTLTYVELLGLNVPIFDLILRQFPRFRKIVEQTLLAPTGRTMTSARHQLFAKLQPESDAAAAAVVAVVAADGADGDDGSGALSIESSRIEKRQQQLQQQDGSQQEQQQQRRDSGGGRPPTQEQQQQHPLAGDDENEFEMKQRQTSDELRILGENSNLNNKQDSFLLRGKRHRNPNAREVPDALRQKLVELNVADMIEGRAMSDSSVTRTNNVDDDGNSDSDHDNHNDDYDDDQDSSADDDSSSSDDSGDYVYDQDNLSDDDEHHHGRHRRRHRQHRSDLDIVASRMADFSDVPVTPEVREQWLHELERIENTLLSAITESQTECHEVILDPLPTVAVQPSQQHNQQQHTPIQQQLLGLMPSEQAQHGHQQHSGRTSALFNGSVTSTNSRAETEPYRGDARSAGMLTPVENLSMGSNNAHVAAAAAAAAATASSLNSTATNNSTLGQHQQQQGGLGATSSMGPLRPSSSLRLMVSNADGDEDLSHPVIEVDDV